MQIVPLQPIPSQAVTVALGGQGCQIDVYQTDNGLFLDLYLNNILIIGGVVCQNLNRIVRSLYLGFQGDLAFIDNRGTDDPIYTGLGPDTTARFNLAYLSPADLGGEG